MAGEGVRGVFPATPRAGGSSRRDKPPPGLGGTRSARAAITIMKTYADISIAWKRC